MTINPNKKINSKSNAKYLNFTLFNDNVPVVFNDLSDFTTKTGISAIVARDLLDNKTPYYKLWKNTSHE